MSTPVTGGIPATRNVSFARPIGPTATAVEVVATVIPAANGSAGIDLQKISESLGGSVYDPRAARATRANFVTDEDVSFDELRLPGINIAQKVGDLGNTFPPGSIILGQEHLILPEPPEKGEGKPQPIGLNVFIIAFRPTRWAEKVPGGERGAIVESREEVVSLGGTTDYDENKRNPGVHLFQELATALVLIEKPAEVDPDGFPFEGPDGKSYTLAVWNMKGVSYTNLAKVVKSAKKIGYPIKGMKGRYLGQGIEVFTVLQKYGQNFAYRPSVVSGRVTDVAFRKFAHECAGLSPYEPVSVG